MRLKIKLIFSVLQTKTDAKFQKGKGILKENNWYF
jgi:hypothetical protein